MAADRDPVEQLRRQAYGGQAAPGMYAEDQGRPRALSDQVASLERKLARAEEVLDERGKAVEFYRDQAHAAREQAAECRLEAAHLHRQLSALGVDPERLAQQVGAGMAVELFGRVYVVRDVALRDLLRDDVHQADADELAAMRAPDQDGAADYGTGDLGEALTLGSAVVRDALQPYLALHHVPEGYSATVTLHPVAPDNPPADDVAVALRLLRKGHTDPDLWTRDDRAAITRLHAFQSPD